jgi:dTDP-glucose 4,6-dehydratase
VVEENPAILVHFAAESHVTRSEREVESFYRTNVQGTRSILEAAARARVRAVIHVSTDEVYGSCHGNPFSESDKQPGEGLATSVYARSKAVADDLALSFADRIPVIVVRPTNCFGPWQHPEKAIPRWITRILRDEPIPVWGDGKQMRDWMFVEDCCSAIELLIKKGTPGEVYNIAPEGSQHTNLQAAHAVAKAAGADEDAVYLTAYDRPRHDRRYAIDASKLRSLGWAPEQDVETRLAETVAWYRDNRWWWEPLVPDAESIYDDAAERGAR